MRVNLLLYLVCLFVRQHHTIRNKLLKSKKVWKELESRLYSQLPFSVPWLLQSQGKERNQTTLHLWMYLGNIRLLCFLAANFCGFVKACITNDP